jgi:hypothetical protein
MRQFFRKLKEWATDSPKAPTESLADLLLMSMPTETVSSRVLRDGLPFHIRWSSERIRDDN